MKQRAVDAVIVGAGATGMWSAYNLSRHGLTVALIDTGGALRAGEATAAHSSELFLSTREAPYSRPRNRPYRWQRIHGIGGRMVAWGRHCLRMSASDFHPPAFEAFGDTWPLTLSELAPHYARVERCLDIAGQRDHLPQVPDSLCTPSRTSSLQRAFKARIEHEWSERRVIAGRLARKPLMPLLMAAVEKGSLSIYPHQRAAEITVARNGARATGVVTIDPKTGERREVKAQHVVLCASAIETACLMLRSKSRHHPDGLGNASGLVGRNLMDHTYVHTWGAVAEPEEIRRIECSYIPKFQNLAGSDAGYLRGFGVQLFWSPCEGECRGFDAPPHRAHFDLHSFGEVLPRLHNRVTLHATRKDALGLPLAHIDFRYSDNEKAMVKHQLAVADELVRVGGLSAFRSARALPPGASIHEVGTVKMGNDPATSVLNATNQSWQVPNLWVMDGSCFVSSGVQNPTLTMLAISGRACDHLVRGSLQTV